MSKLSDFDRETGKRIASLFSAVLHPHTSGPLFSLIHPELDKSQILRDGLFCVTLYSIAELCSEWRTRVVELQRRLKKADQSHPTADYYLYCIAAHMEMAEVVVVSFGNDEIVFASEMRHQFVHAQRSRDFRSLTNWSHENGTIGRAKYSQKKYWEMYRQVVDQFGGIGETCVALRQKLVTTKSNFWLFGRMLEIHGVHVMHDLQNWTDSKINFGTPLQIDGYVEGGELPLGKGEPPISLIEFRRKTTFTDLDHVDPVTAKLLRS